MKTQIVFTEPSGWLGKLVRFLIGGTFTHVHFLVYNYDDVWTYEAFPPKIRLCESDLYSEDQNQVIIDLPLSDDECRVLLKDAVMKIQKCHYGLDDSIRIFVRNRISKKLARKLGKFLQDDYSETCSTLAIKTLRLKWKEFGGKDALDFSPDEVYQVVVEKFQCDDTAFK